MKIAYVAASLRYGGGVRHQGRSLTRHLTVEHDLRVCGAIFPPDAAVFQGQVPDWVMSADELDEVDVVYMEGGWNDDRGGARFSLELAEPFVRRGGQLVVADVGRNEAQTHRRSLEEAARLFGTSVGFGDPELGLEGVRYMYDERARERDGTRFFPSQMTYVDDWLRPSLFGVDSILAESVVELNGWGADIAACGNASTTRVLVKDCFVEAVGSHPWAVVNEYGQGHAVLVGAHVSEDYLVDKCPGNARWIGNLVALLAERSRETAGWAVGKLGPSDAVAGESGPLEQSENERLGRDSSSLASTDNGPAGATEDSSTQESHSSGGPKYVFAKAWHRSNDHPVVATTVGGVLVLLIWATLTWSVKACERVMKEDHVNDQNVPSSSVQPRVSTTPKGLAPISPTSSARPSRSAAGLSRAAIADLASI